MGFLPRLRSSSKNDRSLVAETVLAQRVKEIIAAKDRGNEHFKKRSYANAITEYTKGLAFFEKDDKNTAAAAFDETDPLLDLLTTLLSNRSASYLLSTKYDESLSDAIEVVVLRPSWVKGYFRRAEALLALQQYDSALGDYKRALRRDKTNRKILEERCARVNVHLEDVEMGLLCYQLHPGRELCKKQFLAPIQNILFEFALNMRNIIYLVGNAASREVMVVDACWDIDGILDFCRAENLTVVGAILTHHHVDHAGGLPPPPYDRYGVRVDGLSKLLRKLPHIKAYVNPHDIDEVIKINPEIDRGRFYSTADREIITLPLPPEAKVKPIPQGVGPILSSIFGFSSAVFGGALGSTSSIDSSSSSAKKPSEVISQPPQRILPLTPDPNISSLETFNDHSPSVTTLQFLHTPGHTAGSQCLLVNSTRLLTGDTLFISSCGRCDFPDSNPEQLRSSLARISELPPTTVVFPGHSYGGEWTTIIQERRAGLLDAKARESFFASMGSNDEEKI